MTRAQVSLCLLVALAACPRKKPPIAELTKADGPVEHQVSQHTTWASAAIGESFYIGDAARTGDGGADLVLAGSARIAMQPHTVLRFGGSSGEAKIDVELGEIVLSGGGSYGLQIGDISIGDTSAVRIRANAGRANTVELMVGTAKITTIDGQTQTLKLGELTSIQLGKIKIETVVDAAVPDAAVPDASVPVADAATSSGGEVELEVTGKGAEILSPGETKWTKLPPDQKTLANGTELRLDARTKAKLTARGLTLHLAGGTRARVGDDLVFGMELGTATASIEASTTGKVAVPGGEVGLVAPSNGPGEARIEVNAHGDARVSIVTGSATLTGTDTGATIDLGRGSNATLQKAGTIHPGDVVIPKYFDFRVTIGDTPAFSIHDPAGATAVQFDFNSKCPEGGAIEIDQDARFRTPRVSAGKESANILVKAGGWQYRLRCDSGAVVGAGHMYIAADAGTRPLPKEPPRFPIDADGRNYRVDYQSLIPNIKIKAPGSGTGFKLHLATGGTETTFDSPNGSFDVPGKQLKEGEYTFWVDRDAQKSKISTLKIGFDQTAAQVYIESPVNGAAWGDDIEVSGATLPGWTAKINGSEIPVDRNTRRFHATVAPPTLGNALAIRLSHPQRGVHYYLRRHGK
jgi:hypothetical protein